MRILRNLLSQRLVSGKMSLHQKELVLEHLHKQGGLEYTRRSLDALQAELKSLVEQMGAQDNGLLGVLLETLKV